MWLNRLHPDKFQKIAKKHLRVLFSFLTAGSIDTFTLAGQRNPFIFLMPHR